MIDLHNHLLPGLDDGVETIDEAIFFGKQAISKQVTHIVCSPHYLDGQYDNPSELLERPFVNLKKVFAEKEINVGLSCSQEVRLCPEIIDAVDGDRIICLDPFSRYFQLEFPSNRIPFYAYQIIDYLIQKGYQPIIVHPERNVGFLKEPEKLSAFLDMGALAEVTAPSYLGLFGREIQKLSQLYIRTGMVQLIASDAHGEKRPFVLDEAYKTLVKKEGLEVAKRLKKNAEYVLEGEDVCVKYALQNKRKWWFY